jgi:hypothetical protein
VAKVIYCAERFRPHYEIIKQVDTGHALERDSEGFPAGYLYLELEQPHFI